MQQESFPFAETAATPERQAGKCNHQMRGLKVEMIFLCSTY